MSQPTSFFTGVFSSQEEGCKARTNDLRQDILKWVKQVPEAEEVLAMLQREQFLAAFERWSTIAYERGLPTSVYSFIKAYVDEVGP